MTHVQGSRSPLPHKKSHTKFNDIIEEDRGMKERYTATHLCISRERVHAATLNELQIRNVTARWVLKLLGADHKRERLAMANDI